MAMVNKCTFIGRLTRDPKITVFQSGGKVADLGLALNSKRKDKTSGNMIDQVMFIDCKAFNSEGRKLADNCNDFLKKGSLVYIESRLTIETWEDKNGGGTKSKHVYVVTDMQFLTPKSETNSSGGSNGAAVKPSVPSTKNPQTQQQPTPPISQDEAGSYERTEEEEASIPF